MRIDSKIDLDLLPEIDWSEQPLGKVADIEIAKKIGVTDKVVALKRKSLNIPPFNNYLRYDWDKQPLGDVADEVLAAKLGVSPGTVGYQRRARGIPVMVGRFRVIDWDAQPLGVEKDTVIASHLRVSPTRVGNARNERGIPAVSGRGVRTDQHVDWSTVKWNASDPEIAASLGVAKSAVRDARHRLGIKPPPEGRAKRLDIAWDDQPYGIVSDAEIARRLDCDTTAVYFQRIKRGVPSQHGRGKGIDWNRQPLGREPDTVIARRLGVTSNSVVGARKRRGIPAAKRTP